MIEVYRDKTKLLFVLETLDNLMKNGRVSRIQGSMAGILGIKILCGASDHGTIDVLKKCRGKLSAYDNLIKEMGNKGYKYTNQLSGVEQQRIVNARAMINSQ